MDWYLNPVSTTFTNCENLAHRFLSWSHGLLIYKLKILISTSRELYYRRSRWNHVFAVNSTVPGSRVCTQVIQTIKSPVFIQGLKISCCPPAFACPHIAHPKTSSGTTFYLKPAQLHPGRHHLTLRRLRETFTPAHSLHRHGLALLVNVHVLSLL